LPQIDADGTVYFHAFIEGPGINERNDQGSWRINADGEIQTVWREGQVIDTPPLGTFLFSSVDQILGRNGKLAFTGDLTPRDWQYIAYSDAAFLWDDGELCILAKPGDPIPGLDPQFTYENVDLPRLPTSGESCVFPFSTASDAIDGLMYFDGADYSLVAMTGDPAPGLPQGTQLLRPLFPQHREVGTVVFSSHLDGPTIDSSNDFAHWISDESSLSLLIQEGDQLPNATGQSVTTNGTLSMYLGYNNDYLLTSSLIGNGVRSSNDRGVWLKQQNDPFELVVREGDPAPGTEPGTVFSSLLYRLLDGNGRALIYAQLSGPSVNSGNNSGFWRGTRFDNLELLARRGEQMPGLPPGVSLSSFFAPKSNGTGQVAFTCNISGVGITPSNNTATLMTSPDDEFVLVIQSGDEIDVSRDGQTQDIRTVETFRLWNEVPETGLRSQLNDRGELVHFVAFTDGSQALFVASAPPDCPADTNNDGSLTPADFTAWIAAFNAMAPQCDQNGDGSCTPADFTAWIANFNAGC